MASDNTILNQNTTTGDTLRDLADASGVKWPTAVATYATTVSPGANVLQVVTPSTPMPMGAMNSAGTATAPLNLDSGGNLRVLATPSGTYTVAGTVGISGTVPISAVSLPLPTGAATAANQAPPGTAGAPSAAVLSVQGVPSMMPIKVDGSTVTQPVSGTVAISGIVPVSGTFFQATQPVSNAGTFAVQASQSGTWNIGTVGGITGSITVVNAGTFATQASQVGTWTIQPGNVANTVPWLANESDPAANVGSITALDTGTTQALGQGGQYLITGTPTTGSSVAAPLSAHTTVGILVTGNWTGTLAFERSMDGGTTYVPMSAFLHGVGGTPLSSLTNNGFLFANVGACTNVRIRATSAITGTATVRLLPSFGGELVAAALQGGANMVGQVSASHETSTIFEGTTALTPQFASFALTNSGPTTIVAAAVGKRIRVLRYSVEFDSTVNFNLQSHTTTTLTTGTKYGVANKSSGGAYCPVGIFQTAVGEALDGNLSAPGIVSGELTYILA